MRKETMIPTFNLTFFKGKVKSLLNAVFGENIGIVDIFHQSKMDKTPTLATYFLNSCYNEIDTNNMTFIVFIIKLCSG